MKAAFTLAMCAAFAAAPAFAQVKPAPAVDAAGIYQVYRTTDSKLSCEQIISEYNLLNAQIKGQQAASQQQAQAAAAPAQGGGFGRLLGAAKQSGLTSSIPGLNSLGSHNQVASQALNTANIMTQQQATGVQHQQTSNNPSDPSDEAQRLSRVRNMMSQKNC